MKKVAIAAACLLLLTSAAWADPYVGASLGQTDTGLGDDDTSWKIMGGYTFTTFLGVEGSYRDLGSSDQTIGTTQFGIDASSMDILGVGRYPFSDRFNVFGKAGFAFIDVDATVTDPVLGTIRASDSETELALGAGVTYTVGERVDFRAEYEMFDTANDMDMFSVGAVFRF